MVDGTPQVSKFTNDIRTAHMKLVSDLEKQRKIDLKQLPPSAMNAKGKINTIPAKIDKTLFNEFVQLTGEIEPNPEHPDEYRLKNRY